MFCIINNTNHGPENGQYKKLLRFFINFTNHTLENDQYKDLLLFFINNTNRRPENGQYQELLLLYLEGGRGENTVYDLEPRRVVCYERSVVGQSARAYHQVCFLMDGTEQNIVQIIVQ